MGDGPIDPGQSRLAQRRFLAALRRHLRRAPLRADLRVDTLVRKLRDAEPAVRTAHRGQAPITLTDAELRGVVDGMVADGTLLRTGHRVRLPDAPPALDSVMRERVDRLLATLEAGGATPPPAETIAARLGIPGLLLEQLREAGELVSVAPRIDYSRETWLEIGRRVDVLASHGSVSVRQVRDELDTTRRHAEAILRGWNRLRRT